VEVQRDFVGPVFGKQHKKLELLKSRDGVHAITVVPARNGNPKVLEILICATPEVGLEVREHLLAAILEAEKKAPLKVELPVEPHMIGLIIGKSGSEIKRLATESGARLAVKKEKLFVEGSSQAVTKARELISNLTESHQRITEKVALPAHLVPQMIGKGGLNIRQLTQKCVGCVLRVHPPVQEGEEAVVEVSGSPKAVGEGVGHVTSAVDVLMSTTSEIVYVPRHLVGLIIGKGGKQIRELSEKTGTTMTTLREPIDDDDDSIGFRVSGPAENVREGCKKLAAVASALDMTERADHNDIYESE